MDVEGSNLPPRDLLTGDALREQLRDDNLALLERRDKLLAAAERAPEVIDDEDTAQKVSDFVKQLTALVKAAEAKRVDAKEPYLEGGRGIDGFFKSISDPVGKAKWRVEQVLAVFLRAKEERARREREEAARLAREEQERKARAAWELGQKIRDEQELADAIAAEKAAKTATAEAEKAQKAADAKPAELSRTRGDYGAVASLRTYWTFRDLDRAQLDLEALRAHLPADCLDKAVRSFVAAGGRSLAGVVIYETSDEIGRAHV